MSVRGRVTHRDLELCCRKSQASQASQLPIQRADERERDLSKLGASQNFGGVDRGGKSSYNI